MRLILILSYLFTAIACEKQVPAPCQEITPGAVFKARIHDTWCLPDESLKITFTSVVEDGRCNITGIDCIWPGYAALGLRIETDAGEMWLDTLKTDQTWQGSTEVAGNTLSLLLIEPLVRSDFAVDTASYRFEMVLE
jgi:hypothetical protein